MLRWSHCLSCLSQFLCVLCGSVLSLLLLGMPHNVIYCSNCKKSRLIKILYCDGYETKFNQVNAQGTAFYGERYTGSGSSLKLKFCVPKGVFFTPTVTTIGSNYELSFMKNLSERATEVINCHNSTSKY